MIDDAVAAPPTVADDPFDRWRTGFEDVFALVTGRFAQVRSHRRARLYLLGPLSGAERKNSWVIAEQSGDLTPDGMQRLLSLYSWDAAAIVLHVRSRWDKRPATRSDVSGAPG